MLRQKYSSVPEEQEEPLQEGSSEGVGICNGMAQTQAMTPHDELVRSVGRLLAPRLPERLAQPRSGSGHTSRTSHLSLQVAHASTNWCVRVLTSGLQRKVTTTLAVIPCSDGESWLEVLLAANQSSIELLIEALHMMLVQVQ